MTTRSRLACALGGALLCIAPRASAQTSSVLTLSDGRIIEVIGLRRWTIGMLQDSLAKYAPGDSLQSHACAATLRYTLHFADASSTTFSFGPGTIERVVVAVREPQDSALVKYRKIALDTLAHDARWKPIIETFTRHPGIFWREMQHRLDSRSSAAPNYRNQGDSVLASRFVRALSSRNRERDRLEAMRTLARDPNMYDRIAAAAVLANFPKRDETWWALAEALREEDGVVKGVASTVLVGLSRSNPRKVSWSPRAASLHAMLNGTSLFSLTDLMGVLVATQVGPADARGLVGNGGGDMLLAYLGSQTSHLAAASRTLLTRLRGADLGPEADAWRAWMVTL